MWMIELGLIVLSGGLAMGLGLYHYDRWQEKRTEKKVRQIWGLDDENL